MRPTIDLVRDFHVHTVCKNPKFPRGPSSTEALLRIQLMGSELFELAEALLSGDIVKILDGLSDLQYTIDGTYLSCGFDAQAKDDAFLEVHRSNMTKITLDGETLVNGAGRIQKGPDYKPPRLEPIIWEANERAKEVLSKAEPACPEGGQCVGLRTYEGGLDGCYGPKDGQCTLDV